MLDGRSILITGGTGSLGRALLMRILRGEHGTPERVVVFSRDEAKQMDLRLQLSGRVAATEDVVFDRSDDVRFLIGDVRDPSALIRALTGIDTVIHAAALKQVPVCEEAPGEAIATNVLGAQNLIEAVRAAGGAVDTVIGVSTDKACEPVNVMGMTKALQERAFIGANVDLPTRFACVRYGNVVGSRGSVVPMFRAQVEAGGPITVTEPGMTRFLLTMEHAVDTVLAAMTHAARGEIIVPRLSAARVGDIVAVLDGGRNLPVEELGIRPGEKRHEVLVSSTEAPRTRGCSEGDRDYVAIMPMLPELVTERADAPAMDRAFVSSDVVMSREELAPLIAS